MSKISIIAGLVLGSTLIGGAVSAQTFTAFDLSSGTPGNQQYGATLGVAFTVNSPILVTSLGAFDAATAVGGGAHTLNGTIVTTIYNSLTQAPVAGLSSSFTAASPGTLQGSYLYKPTANNGVLLLPGNYVVAFTSITNNDQSAAGNIPAPTFNEGGNLITINKTTIQYNEQVAGSLGVDRYPGAGSATQQLYGGTFKYTANTPEPCSTVSLFGGLFVAGATVLRRRMRKKTK